MTSEKQISEAAEPPVKYRLEPWEHSILTAVAKSIAESYAAHQRLVDARLAVVRMEAALLIAQAELIEAESAKELSGRLTELALAQAERVERRAESHMTLATLSPPEKDPE